ncbi:MAG: ribosome recycling factor [Rhodospirillaceae bacterium]|nr:ribosome recycling factor [Rhodospirillaceae bacterium]|tara:strand:+ start:2819 stop:3376 length:558 start_codon:yes stop_codon:yes gene_type:complete
MIDELQRDGELRMRKSVEALKEEFSRLRTGRAHVGLLEHITVEYYGSEVPISQTATIAVEDARTLLVTPWEKQMVPVVEKAIITSDLGLTPATAGTAIRVPLPPMTEERRKEMVKVVRGETEAGRVAIRNIRRDVLGDVKDLLKEKMITLDDEHKAHEEVQKITDNYISQMEALLAEKEKEIMDF